MPHPSRPLGAAIVVSAFLLVSSLASITAARAQQPSGDAGGNSGGDHLPRLVRANRGDRADVGGCGHPTPVGGQTLAAPAVHLTLAPPFPKQGISTNREPADCRGPARPFVPSASVLQRDGAAGDPRPNCSRVLCEKRLLISVRSVTRPSAAPWTSAKSPITSDPARNRAADMVSMRFG